ncbi:uroporphyrinogen-III synthase [Arthrobacter cryoconiti]|uniref:Uroporphyrinogen-III synthase n=1 Tax=Arthrobacter cryoconiti TaxID=748907 RepID=A0ABV8QZF9_9MICC|nr:uroporphyrinogen-III synthase [Arthrobacter cryoconiti]MCC9068344.1 uroporphyrinogen-III synthase [Arthrobacter cryoconiti]
MTESCGPRQDRHSLGDFPAISRGRPSASLTSPTQISAPGAGQLTGLRVAVTRSADRAGALADALAAAGAEPVLVPLIDFETADQGVLGAALARLCAGEYRWLVISSITTVRALKQWCESAGTTLAALIPQNTKVATIGPTSVAVLAAEGIMTNLAPTNVQSGAGLVALWPELATTQEIAQETQSGRVLLPQSDVASPTIVDGIRAKGWSPEVTTAYKTVDYPASPSKRLSALLAHSTTTYPAGNHTELTPAQAGAEFQAGLLDAVVLASGSAARRLAAAMGPIPPRCLVIAIGQPTRTEALRLGIQVSATAAHPTPDGIVTALAQARARTDTMQSRRYP